MRFFRQFDLTAAICVLIVLATLWWTWVQLRGPAPAHSPVPMVKEKIPLLRE